MPVHPDGAWQVITIVDYGTSNLGSMQNMLKKFGASSSIAASAGDLEDATKIIVPGVGSFDAGMKKLRQSGMIPVLNRKALVERVPTLGVCLGMQLMTESSDEGDSAGLGWIEARTVRFDQRSDPGLKVPHMGWNEVKPAKISALVSQFPTEARFYFAHSFYVICTSDEDVLLTATYGATTFAAAFQRGNLIGAQFHPEKSHSYGMMFLRNFVEQL
jgi:imidazole glycerol-phosphate synthase subunit HisH